MAWAGYGASLSFATTTHLWLPSGHALAEPIRATGRKRAARSFLGCALCLFDVAFPL
jgi:hypothetical protein